MTELRFTAGWLSDQENSRVWDRVARAARGSARARARLAADPGRRRHENEDWELLEWARRFLLNVTATLGTPGSAYDAYRDETFRPLDIAKILGKLRAGTLVKTVPLSHYMIRHELIDPGEMRSLAKSYADTGFRYFETSTGDYVLDNLF